MAATVRVKVVRAFYGPQGKVHEVGSTVSLAPDKATEAINAGKAVLASAQDQHDVQAVFADEQAAQDRADARGKKE